MIGIGDEQSKIHRGPRPKRMRQKSSDPFLDPELEALINNNVPNLPPSERNNSSRNGHNSGNASRRSRNPKPLLKENIDNNVASKMFIKGPILPAQPQENPFGKIQNTKIVIDTPEKVNARNKNRESESEEDVFTIDDEKDPFQVCDDEDSEVQIEELPNAPSVPIEDDDSTDTEDNEVNSDDDEGASIQSL